MILGTIVANNANVPVKFVLSLLQVTKYHVVIHEGASIPHNRNAVFERARLEGESLLFIDSDIVFTLSDVKKIEKHLETKDVISGVYVMGFPGFPPAIFDSKFHVKEPEVSLFEIGASGAGFLGISSKVIQTLTEPFTPRPGPNGRYYGEDISFAMNAKDAGFSLFCDPTIKVGHIKPQTKYYQSPL